MREVKDRNRRTVWELILTIQVRDGSDLNQKSGGGGQVVKF